MSSDEQVRPEMPIVARLRDAWTVLTGMAAGVFITEFHPYVTVSEHAPRWILITCSVICAVNCYSRVRAGAKQ